ncbi:hypothetical protein AAVH_19056, partial [Aphelenchoides avenae]
FTEPIETEAFAIFNSPLDPQLPCKICAIRTVQLFYIEPDAALSVKFNTWRADTPMGLARMAAVFNSAAITDDEKVTWYQGDRTMPVGIDHNQWVERALRAFLEQCRHRNYALGSLPNVARDYEHLAMECAHRTFTVRNRIAVIGGSNARGLAHCLGKDAQFVEADTSEVIAARAAKLFPSRMIRLIIIWPQQQQHPLGLWESPPARTGNEAHARSLLRHDAPHLDNTTQTTLHAIGTNLVTYITDNKERSFFSDVDLRPSCIEGVARICEVNIKDAFGMTVKVHQLHSGGGGHGPKDRSGHGRGLASRLGRKRSSGRDDYDHQRASTSPKKARVASQVRRVDSRNDDAGPTSSSTRRK